MDFSANMLTTGGQRLRDMERAAKQAKIGIWTNYVAAPTNQGKLSGAFTGKVGEKGRTEAARLCVGSVGSEGATRRLAETVRVTTADSWRHLHPVSGQVIEVVSGDCLVVKEDRVERRLQLSSLRAPRVGTQSRPADPYAAEAKEFLRKKLVCVWGGACGVGWLAVFRNAGSSEDSDVRHDRRLRNEGF